MIYNIKKLNKIFLIIILINILNIYFFLKFNIKIFILNIIIK